MSERIGIFSRGILRLPLLAVLLKATPVRLRAWRAAPVDVVAGWGLRPTTRKAVAYAGKHGLPYVALEDGFLRSFGTGEHFPPLSLVVDDAGIYYDCTRPSALEQLLSSDADVLAPYAALVRQAAKLLSAGLSKYNHAPDLPAGVLRADDVQRVLVVDQTAGDMSVAKGGADAATFEAMLAAALAENPQATVYVKTHPEVTSGRKSGYLTRVQPDARTVVLRDAVNPMSLIAQMDKVYVVSSTMGFEALLASKPVVCFGVPWYSGWGATDDRQPQHAAMGRRAGCRRSVDELFAAGYMHYTRYLNPETRQLGSIADVTIWLDRQREMAERYSGRMICVGFPRWRAWNFRQMLSLHAKRVVHARSADAAAALKPERDDCLVCWGRVPPEGVQELAAASGVRLLRMEDGFVRSVGLGSDLIPPQSFVLDAKGIYFDRASLRSWRICSIPGHSRRRIWSVRAMCAPSSSSTASPSTTWSPIARWTGLTMNIRRPVGKWCWCRARWRTTLPFALAATPRVFARIWVCSRPHALHFPMLSLSSSRTLM